jgi:haloalkane dehalogenase
VTAWPDRKQYKEILGRRMAYVESGGGPPVVFLHGNPTSSFLWRNVIAEVESVARCVAPDLIGMGDSEKLPESGPESYRLAEHQRYVDAFLEAMGFDAPLVLVIHDWGSALGFDWARRHPDRVRGIVYMEAMVCPASLEEWPGAKMFSALRSPDGEGMVLDRNLFVETILPRSIIRPLTDEEMDEYRRPFLEPGEGRRPTLTWPRQIPLDGEPPDVVETVERYGQWLEETPVPKLFINADPGAIVVGRLRDYCRTWPNQREITVPGIHFIQEDSGPEIGRAIVDWLDSIS